LLPKDPILQSSEHRQKEEQSLPKEENKKSPVTKSSWACSECTFENENKNSKSCEICGNARQEIQSFDLPSSSEINVIQQPTSSISDKINHSLNELVTYATRADSVNALQTLELIFKNILEHASEEKYRKISVTSKAFQQKIAKHRGCLDIVKIAGFEGDKDNTAYYFKRNDLGLIWLAKSLVQDKLEFLEKSEAA